jgi:hypothetical protein
MNCCYLSLDVSRDALLQCSVVDLPSLELSLATSGEQQRLLAVQVQGPDFHAMSNDSLDAVLRRQIP